MSDIEDLKARKEKLALEKEIRQLERREKLENSARGWSWWWVGVLALVSAYFLLIGLGLLTESKPGGALIVLLGVLAASPLVLKIRCR